MTLRTLIFSFSAGLVLCACQMVDPGTDQEELDFLASFADAPDNAEPGTCWGKIIKPAVIETEIVQDVIKPEVLADDGTILEAAEYETKQIPQIAQERSVDYFRAPCADDLVPDFNASLQRALATRDFYQGPISGLYDQELANAVKAYQISISGPSSGTLSLEAGLKLGLIAVERPSEDI